jgi:CRP-like cAMP-binding protein
MPDDLIMTRGELGNHIYFFVEGSALVLGPDNTKIIRTLEPGDYIGELATLIGATRNVSVRANSFVLVKEISKAEIESVLATYPEIHEEMK